MSGRWRNGVLSVAFVVLSACFGTYAAPQPTEATTEVADPSSTTAPATSAGLDSSTSATAAGSSTSTSDGTGLGSCEHVDFLFLLDNGMDPAYTALLMTTIVSNATNISTWLGGLDSIHFGLTTTASVPGNGEQSGCTGPGSLLQAPDLAACPEQPFFDSVDDLNNLVLCFGSTLFTPGPPGEVSTPLLAITNAVSPMLSGPGGCNHGFHASGDPIVIILFTDSDDGSMVDPALSAGSIFLQEGLPPSSVALVVIAGPVDGCDGAGGDGGEPITCGADEVPIEAACRIDGFSQYLLDDQGLSDHARFWNLCEAQQDDSVLLEALEMGFTQLVPLVCSG